MPQTDTRERERELRGFLPLLSSLFFFLVRAWKGNLEPLPPGPLFSVDDSLVGGSLPLPIRFVWCAPFPYSLLAFDSSFFPLFVLPSSRLGPLSPPLLSGDYESSSGRMGNLKNEDLGIWTEYCKKIVLAIVNIPTNYCLKRSFSIYLRFLLCGGDLFFRLAKALLLYSPPQVVLLHK